MARDVATVMPSWVIAVPQLSARVAVCAINMLAGRRGRVAGGRRVFSRPRATRKKKDIEDGEEESQESLENM